MKVTANTMYRVNSLVQDAANRHAPCDVWAVLCEDGVAIRGCGHDRGSVTWTIEDWSWEDLSSHGERE